MNKILILISCSILLTILLFANVSFYWADDYCFQVSIAEMGVLNKMKSMYLTWDGRSISPAAFFQYLFIGFLDPKLNILIWAFCLILSGWLSIKIFEDKLNLNGNYQFILLAFVSASLWYGMRTHIAETVYWATGGLYILINVFGLGFIYWFNKSLKDLNNRTVVTSFLFALLLGLCSQNFTLGLLIYIGIDLIKRDFWNKGNKGLRTFYFSAISGLVIGTLIITLAPGNFLRAANEPRSFEGDFITLFINFVEIFEFYAVRSKALIVLAIAAGLISGFFSNGQKPKFKYRFIDDTKWLFAALATILPFIFIPDFASRRTAIYFMSFLFLFGFGFGIKLSYLIAVVIKHELLIISSKYSIILFSSFFLYTAFNQYKMANELYKEVKAREIILQNSNKQNDLILEPLIVNYKLFVTRYSEIDSISNRWDNKCLANYWQLKSVRIE